MFEKLKAKLEELQAQAEKQFDSSQFNDPVALKTKWQPLKPGGANFKTNALVKVSPSVYRYQLSTGGKLFIGLFGTIGIVAFLFGLNMTIQSDISTGFFPMLFGSIFTLVAYITYRSMGTPKVFDSSLGFFWIGHKQPGFSGDQKTDSNHLIYFSEIKALQILSERVRSKNGSYYSYEINLVMKDASRFNVVDHGSYTQIRVDAELLSEMMAIPIWDVST